MDSGGSREAAGSHGVHGGGQASGPKEIALQIESWRVKQRQGGLLLGYCIK